MCNMGVVIYNLQNEFISKQDFSKIKTLSDLNVNELGNLKVELLNDNYSGGLFSSVDIPIINEILEDEFLQLYK